MKAGLNQEEIIKTSAVDKPTTAVVNTYAGLFAIAINMEINPVTKTTINASILWY